MQLNKNNKTGHMWQKYVPNWLEIQTTPKVEDRVAFDDCECEIHLNITHNKFTSTTTDRVRLYRIHHLSAICEESPAFVLQAITISKYFILFVHSKKLSKF